jgi:hypothetical protein
MPREEAILLPQRTASIFNNFLGEPNPGVYTELTPLYTMWMKWRRSRNAGCGTVRPGWVL